MKVSVMGTGIMGSRMAQNLLKAGHEVMVYNRTKANTEPVLDAGGARAGSPAEAASEAEVVITMLPKPDVIEAVAISDEGFLKSMRPNTIWIDSSTTNPSFARSMAEAAATTEVQFVEAPVAGSKNQAANAELVFFVGADKPALETCRPLFDVMGNKTVHVGPVGQANALKLVINHMLATSMLAFAEGMVLGESLGLSKETLLNTLIGGGVVTAPFIGAKRANIENDTFDVEFPLQWMQKDMAMVAATAFESDVAMPLANATKETYQLAKRYGHGEQDFSAIYAFLAEQS
jgi:3-hydroxyisobutyrate dehydrogenase-like beta-hydroxyacid dehydrogenase